MKIKTYQWKDGAHVPEGLSATDAAREFDRIAKAGELTAPSVVDAARPKRSVLHGCFVWDDAEAARLHRETTARDLIRSVSVVVESDGEEEKRTVRAYHYDETAYRRTDEILSDPDSRGRLLVRAKAEMLSWRQRYADLRELASVFAEVDKLAT